MVTRTRRHVPDDSVGCVRAWGLRNGIGTVVLTKIGRACALGEDWRTVRRPCRFSRDRSSVSACSHRAFKRTIAILSAVPRASPVPKRRLIARSAISSPRFSARRSPRHDRRGESDGRDGQSSRVDDRDISSKRARRRYRGAAACRWKFYQYRGGHLVSLWQSLAKSYAPNADRELTPSRPINRRGLPE